MSSRYKGEKHKHHVKYNSIKNHYLIKEVNYFKEYHKEILPKVKFCIEEKIHGCNFSFLFRPDKAILHFSRNKEIVGNEFMNSAKTISEMDKKLTSVQEYVNKTDFSVRLFGEYFGKGIQKGINYGEEKRIIFFNVMINSRFISQKKAKKFFLDLDIPELFIKQIQTFDTFEEALDFNPEFDSIYNTIINNICEGVVIKPYTHVLVDGNGIPFFLKNKNLKEKINPPKEKKPRKKQRSEVEKYRQNFLRYINEERVQSVFSKEGRIESLTELGKFILLITEDAKESFLEEEEFKSEDLSKKEQRYIFNVSKQVALFLKKELGFK